MSSYNFNSFNAKEMELCSYNDKWVVKRLKFGSYCMTNCGETGTYILPEFLDLEWLISGWLHILSWQVIILTSNPTYLNCWVSHCWPVGCTKRDQNDINIAKPCMYKMAGSGINEMIFPSFSWTYLLFISHWAGVEK